MASQSSDTDFKLADFGHARKFSRFQRCYTIDVCTPPYRAIELWLKHSNYDVDVDMWAFGCTAFEIFTGRFLFDDEDKSIECLVQHMEDHIRPGFLWSDLVTSLLLQTILSCTIRHAPRMSAVDLKMTLFNVAKD